MYKYVSSTSQDDFVARQVRSRKIKKFIHDSVKDNPNVKLAKEEDRKLTQELKDAGKEYHRDSREWY